MPVGEVTVRLNLNKDGYSAGMTAARKEAQQTVKTIESMGHTTVSTMQASSAAIRVLEGGMTGNIRAAERFIGMIPGVGKALQAAFPVIGGIALAGVFVKIGDEAAKAIQKVEQAEQSITNSFRALNLSGQSANDTLAITNDRLENEIAKLQGKPENNLKIAIDEARLAADKMAESLDRDNTKIKELLSQNAVPWWAGLLGKAGTSNVSDTVNTQNQHLADLAAQANILQHSGDQAGADRKRAEIDSTRQQFLRDNATDIGNRRASQNLPGGLNQGANVSIDLGQQSSLLNQVDQENELKRNLSDQALKQKLDDQKAQDEAAKRALAAMKAAQEAIVAQWRKDLDEQRTTFDNALVQEGQFWVQRMESARKGSLSYIAALDEANKDIARMHAENVRSQKEFDKTATISPDSMDLSRSDTGTMKDQGRDAADYLKSLNQGIESQRANADAIAEASLQMEIMTGRISALDAARVQATIHEHQYQQAVEDVESALAAAENLPEGAFKSKTISDLNTRRGQVDTAHTIQLGQDQQAVSSQQIVPAMKQAVNDMVKSFQDMAATLKDVIPRTMNSLNDDIVKAMTGRGRAADFGKTFMNAGDSLLKTGLQGAEGKILGQFGLGPKATPGSSPVNPSYTVIVGGGGGAGIGGGSSAGLGSILGKLPGVGQYIQPFQGFFAGGGDVLANYPAMVGESGPEMFVPHAAGRIVPNSQLGGESHVYHIDARGSNDPMAVHAAVARALPHAVSASVQANHQAKMRSPGGR